MSSRSTALFQPVSFARESHLHYVEQSSPPGMPGADSPDEGRNRGPTHEQFTGLAFSINPRVATKGNDEPLNGQDVLLVALGDSQCTVSNTAVVHGAEKVGFAHLESRRSSKDYT